MPHGRDTGRYDGRDEDRKRDEFERLRPEDAELAPGSGGRAARYAEAVEEGNVDLRPRGVGEVLDQGLELLRARFAVCVVMATLAWIPIRFLTALLVPQEVITGEDIDAFFDQIRDAMVSNVAIAVGQLLVAAVTARVVADVIEGRETRIGSTLRVGVSRLPGLIAIGFFTYVLAAVGICCMAVVPGLVVLWLMAPCAYIYVLEDVDVRTAVRRSKQISCARLFSADSFFAFWRWAGIVIVASMLVSPFTTLAALSETPLMRDWALGELAISAPAYDALSILLGALFMGIGIAVQAGVLTAYYLDCRIRREGLDLQRWIDRLRPAPAVPGSVLP